VAMILRELNGLVVATSTLLDGLPAISHAVSTRLGGVSKSHPYRSLNLSWKWNDSRVAVEENHQLLCEALNLDRASLVSPQQVHGSEVRLVSRSDRGSTIPGCDGLITKSTGVTLLLRFADCVPILLYDSRNHAVGLAHAGWRGTVGGIATRAVEAMISEFGSDATDMNAVVGPSIGPCCYEVGDVVIAAAEQTFGTGTSLLADGPNRLQRASCPTSYSLDAERAPAKQSEHPKKHFDLWAANEQLLRAAGVARIEVTRLCTACNNDTFFSYRAGRGRTGLHGALICLNQ